MSIGAPCSHFDSISAPPWPRGVWQSLQVPTLLTRYAPWPSALGCAWAVAVAKPARAASPIKTGKLRMEDPPECLCRRIEADQAVAWLDPRSRERRAGCSRLLEKRLPGSDK